MSLERETDSHLSLSSSDFFCVGQCEPSIFFFLSLAETTTTTKHFGSDQIYIPSLFLSSWDEKTKQIMLFSTIVSFAPKRAISLCALSEKQRQGTARVSQNCQKTWTPIVASASAGLFICNGRVSEGAISGPHFAPECTPG